MICAIVLSRCCAVAVLALLMAGTKKRPLQIAELCSDVRARVARCAGGNAGWNRSSLVPTRFIFKHSSRCDTPVLSFVWFAITGAIVGELDKMPRKTLLRAPGDATEVDESE